MDQRRHVRMGMWVSFSLLLPGILAGKGFQESAPVTRWDRAGAHKALDEARKQRDGLARNPQADRAAYLDCLRAYELVYRKDPHCPCSDDAVYEEGQVSQEAAEKFGAAADYYKAATLFRFLIRGYPTSRMVPDALLRLGNILAGPLNDEKAAEETYLDLRTRFRNSQAAAQLADRIASPAKSPVEGGAEPAVANVVTVHNIRHWTTSDYTRVTIDLDGETPYTHTRLSDPQRIYFDIANAHLSRDLLNRTFVVGNQLLKQVRVAQNRLDLVRVVFDFETIRDFTILELHNPFRIVVDIHGAGSQAAVASAEKKASPAAQDTAKSGSESAKKEPGGHEGNPNKESAAPAPRVAAREAQPAAVGAVDGSGREDKPQAAKAGIVKEAVPLEMPASRKEPAVAVPRAAAPTSRGSRTLTRALGLKIGRIVIDAGHGGHDTGTVGRTGLAEKDLVLQVAMELRSMLVEKLGAEVIMTREEDIFVPLEERTAIANQARADLFISIHANSSGSRATSGPETYFLNFAKTEAEKEVAARENATTMKSTGELQNLIRKIAQADKSMESRELAGTIQKRLYGGSRQLFPTARNRGVRSAPFVVLIGANMPSVLAEIAFISNPRDEKTLKVTENQRRVATALYAGIEGYVKTLGLNVALNPGTSP